MDGRTDGRTDRYGWMDGWTDGWMDGRTDGWTRTRTCMRARTHLPPPLLSAWLSFSIGENMKYN
jgi:hypothetical protein